MGGRGLAWRNLVAGLVLAIGLLPRPAAALPPELEYAKGVVSFSQDQLDQARAHFEAVLAARPDHPQATYYLGQVVLGQDRPLEAIPLFERALSLSPDKAGIRLDLALALIKAQRYARAERILLAAEATLGQRASFQYYLGLSRYHQGRFRDALPALERAQALDDGFAATAGYYLGLAHYRLGQQAEAARQFEHLAAGEGTGVGSLARENLAAMAAPDRGGSSRRWGLMGSLGVGYDSNVTLDTDGTASADAPTSFVSVGAWGTPWHSKGSALDLALNLYRTFHLGGSERIGGLNLTDLAAIAQFRHAFEGGQLLELAYLGDVDMLDDLAQATGAAADGGFGVFMHGHALEARVRIPEGRISQTAVAYRFQARFFHPHGDGAPDRDDFNHELTLRQELSVLDRRVRLGLEIGGLFQDARDRHYDVWGLLAGLDARFQLADSVDAWARLGWRRADHHRSAAEPWVDREFTANDITGRRVDDRFSGALGLTWRFTPKLSVGAAYRYLNNDSNGLFVGDQPDGVFRYQRHLVHVMLQGRL